MCFSSDMSKWGIDDKLHLSLSNIDHRLISTLKENKIILDDDIDERNMVLPLFPLVGMPVYSVLTVSSFMPSNSNLKYSSSL